MRSNDLGQCVFPRVETWLRSFREASFVVTDSFHGSVFAILFNRPFVAKLETWYGEVRVSFIDV
ncbi:polysaccharide pyruvyl transferase family protein [Marinobacter sp. LV10R510-11A]|uniref:polysaccharide pyruvyl transferase family protein n=1 Tax=Marinobacter sp. LV10R510-11A TaxID=1415568 RepID=UPI0012FD1A56